MLQHRIAKRYAKSLFLVGEREGQTDRLGEELDQLSTDIRETEGLLGFLANPSTNTANKHRILEEVIARTEFSVFTQRFLKVLLNYSRVQLLPEISVAYGRLLDEARSVIRGTVTSAEELSDKQIKDIQSALEKSTGRTVVLSSECDPQLIAGFRVHIADVTLDASVEGQLNAMTHHLRSANA